MFLNLYQTFWTGILISRKSCFLWLLYWLFLFDIFISFILPQFFFSVKAIFILVCVCGSMSVCLVQNQFHNLLTLSADYVGLGCLDMKHLCCIKPMLLWMANIYLPDSFLIHVCVWPALYCELKRSYFLSSTGIRTEQDFYVRLIDSMTKQVRRYFKIPTVCWWILSDLQWEWTCVCRAPWWVWGYTLACLRGTRIG